MKQTILALSISFLSLQSKAEQTGDQILGSWKADDKVLTIEIQQNAGTYTGRIISFTDHHNTTPSDQRLDEKNPNPALRSRKLVGLTVLTGLHYDPSSKTWTGGRIYDAGSGNSYDVSVELLSSGKLSVRAYKGVRLLGKTLTFHR
jgi:uncharacterized protein (DUF2147 family)